jgi:uncharacterized protein (DUF1778 family)
MAATTFNSARIDFRTTPDVKILIEQAATVYGMTVSEFAKSVLVEKSREVVQFVETRTLSDRDRDVFLSLLESPAKPNAALRSAADRFKSAVKQGDVLI